MRESLSNPEQVGSGQIGIQNKTFSVNSQVTNGSKMVEILVIGLGLLQCKLRHPQRVVLQFQFHVVDLEFVYQFLEFSRR